jgi:uncharacterized membrane protein
MKTKNTNLAIIMLIVAAFVAGAVLYPQLPEKFASHWDASGQVNGYMNKFWGTFLMPFIMLGLFALYFIIPKIDPFKANIESFRKYYNMLWILLLVFFLYIFGLTLIWNLGWRFNFTNAIVPAISVLWFFMGIFLEKLKRNWFMGIRTPWTLSSDIVWEKTHRLSGKLFKIAAVVSLLGLFLNGEVAIAAIIIPAIAVAIIAVIYSYTEYRKINI